MDCDLSMRWLGMICEGESLIRRKDGSCVDTIVCADAVVFFADDDAFWRANICTEKAFGASLPRHFHQFGGVFV